MADDLSPVYQGDLSLWTLTTYYRGTTAVRPLTGISAGACSYKLQPVGSSAPVSNGTGAIAILSPASNGQLTISPGAADVATPGEYLLWLLIPWDGSHLQHSDPYPIEIKYAP